MTQVSDINIEANIVLPAPELLALEIPRTEAQAAFIAANRAQIHRIIFGDDRRHLMIVGPCSIHDVDAGLDYARRLAALAEQVKDRILLVMRVYFEKPRTSVGWKGLIMDPHLDGSCSIHEGIRMARKFLRDVIDCGVGTATELLDPITPQYIADLICWSAIGARTTESQIHRQMASGLSMPLGFKNNTAGDIQSAINAIKAAMSRQTFIGVSSQGLASAVTTKGNPNCHVILRGGLNGPNYDRQSVAATAKALEGAGLVPAVMIDACHENSGKDPAKVPAILDDVLAQVREGTGQIIGTMVESNIKEGSQKIGPREELVYGKSITDPCVDWDTTVNVVEKLYAGLPV